MPDEKPLSVDGFVDGVRKIKYNDGFSDFDFEIERTASGERVRHEGNVGPEYPRILTGWAHNIMVGSKLGYVAATGNETVVMNFDGVEGPEYPDINSPLVGIEGNLFYVARKENGMMVANFDNLEGKEYQRVMCPANIAGKPAYIAQMIIKKEGKNTFPWFVVFDGKEGPKYYWVWMNPKEVNGKLAYLAEIEQEGEWLLNYDQVEFENRYAKKKTTETMKAWPAHTACFVVDGKELVGAHARLGERRFFDGREISHPSLVHFLVEHELAKQRGGNEK